MGCSILYQIYMHSTQYTLFCHGGSHNMLLLHAFPSAYQTHLAISIWFCGQSGWGAISSFISQPYFTMAISAGDTGQLLWSMVCKWDKQDMQKHIVQLESDFCECNWYLTSLKFHWVPIEYTEKHLSCCYGLCFSGTRFTQSWLQIWEVAAFKALQTDTLPLP